MGIFDALNTSVGGLQAQSFALQNISGNIANASTVGYKGINTSFEDLIPAALAVNKQVAGGVTAHAQQTITTQGTVSNSTVATNIAINGDGFFDVQKPTGITDNVPTFNGVTNYTRAGDFQVNAQGYLVNSSGYYLMGQAVDPKTGNPLGSVPTVLQFNNNFVPAQATTTIQYSANLPTVPKTTASPNATTGSFVAQGGLNPADFSQNPEVLGTAPPAFGNSAVVGNQVIIGGTPISNTTALSTLPTSVAGKSITVDGHVINFVSGPASAPTSGAFTGAGPFTINVNDPTTGTPPGATLGTLLGAIDTINGNTANPSTISTTGTPGEITLNTGVAANLVISDNNSNALFSQLGFSADPAATRTGGGGTGTGVVANADLTTFENESVAGGAVTVYNSAGTPVNVQLRWALTAPNTWNLFYQSNSSPTTPGDTTWTNVGQTFTFNSNGNLVSPTGGGITIPNLTINNQQVGDVRTQHRLRRAVAICVHRRQRDRRPDHPERLCRRSAPVGRHRQLGPRGRHLLQRAEHRPRPDHAVALQRHELPASARRPGLCGDRGVRTGDPGRLGHDRGFVARRFQHRYRRRVHEADCDPAGLFGQHQGDHHGQRHGSELAERVALIGAGHFGPA